MKTRFFFPVVAMIAFATVNNAAAFKVGGTTPRIEVASVEKVDARAGAETSVCGVRQSGLSGFTSGTEADAKAGAEVARRLNVNAKAESGFLAILQKGIDTKTGAEVAAIRTRDKVDVKLAKLVNGHYDATLATKGWLDSKENAKLAFKLKKLPILHL